MRKGHAELPRYVINGLIATAVHYLALFSAIEYLKFESAGAANLMAATFGISASFLGNRYFVFRSVDEKLLDQAIKFVGLYSVIGLIHGATLYILSDIYKLNYNFGFFVAITIQVLLGYAASKRLVFNKR